MQIQSDQDAETILAKNPITLAMYYQRRKNGELIAVAWHSILRVRPDLQKAALPTEAQQYLHR